MVDLFYWEGPCGGWGTGRMQRLGFNRGAINTNKNTSGHGYNFYSRPVVCYLSNFSCLFTLTSEACGGL